MIVEIFYKGTNFKKHFMTKWNILKIERDGEYFILVRENNDNETINTNKFELKVSF